MHYVKTVEKGVFLWASWAEDNNFSRIFPSMPMSRLIVTFQAGHLNDIEKSFYKW